MKPQCPEDSLPRACGEQFARIAGALARLERAAEDIRAVRRAVLGNGRAEESLAFRVGRLEEGRQRRVWQAGRWLERAWKLCVSAALVLLGWWIRRLES